MNNQIAPTPWKVIADTCGDVYIVSEVNGHIVAVMDQLDCQNLQHRNASHIVACVNAAMEARK